MWCLVWGDFNRVKWLNLKVIWILEYCKKVYLWYLMVLWYWYVNYNDMFCKYIGCIDDVIKNLKDIMFFRGKIWN